MLNEILTLQFQHGRQSFQKDIAVSVDKIQYIDIHRIN